MEIMGPYANGSNKTLIEQLNRYLTDLRAERTIWPSPEPMPRSLTMELRWCRLCGLSYYPFDHIVSYYKHVSGGY